MKSYPNTGSSTSRSLTFLIRRNLLSIPNPTRSMALSGDWRSTPKVMVSPKTPIFLSSWKCPKDIRIRISTSIRSSSSIMSIRNNLWFASTLPSSILASVGDITSSSPFYSWKTVSLAVRDRLILWFVLEILLIAVWFEIRSITLDFYKIRRTAKTNPYLT